MKKEDLNKIALEILRINGNNNWQKLNLVCKAMHIKLNPIFISSKKENKCRFYLNNFYFPNEGVGKTQSEANCNAVEKFLNTFINISKISSTTDCILNNHDVRFEVVSKTETQKITNQNGNLPLKDKKIVSLADMILSKFTRDLWKVLNECCAITKINFIPKFIRCDEQFCCSFLFDEIKFEQHIESYCRIESGRKLAEAFIKEYASSYDEYLDKIDRLFTLVAAECKQSKRVNINDILSKQCEDLNIEVYKQFSQISNVFHCKINLNHKPCQITGVGVTEEAALNSAIEILFVKFFSSQMFAKIQNWKNFNKIAKFCSSNKFSDEWKSLCNSCLLLGFKRHERFTESDGIFSLAFFIENENCEIIGSGTSRNEAGIRLSKLFVEKYLDLKKLFIEFIANLDDKEFYFFVITLCVDKFWLNNWQVLSEVCSKFKINLTKHMQSVNFNRFRCSMNIGIHHYDNSITLADQDLAFNLLANQFFSKYSDKQLSGDEVKKILKEIDSANSSTAINDKSLIGDVSLSRLEIFHKIATFCKFNQKSDDWKTLCNACKSLNYNIYERFINLDSKILCEIYIDNESINITEISSTRKQAACSLARKFVDRYQHGNTTVKASKDVILKNITESYLKSPVKGDEWKTLCNTCKSLNYKLVAYFISHENHLFECNISIEDFPFRFGGKFPTRKEAGIFTAKSFIEKYNCSNTGVAIESSGDTGEENAAIYKKIAIFSKKYPYQNYWEALSSACRMLDYKIQKTVTEENDDFCCRFSIKNDVINLTGRGKSDKKASINAARQFIDKYYETKDSPFNPSASQQLDQKLLPKIFVCEPDFVNQKIHNNDAYKGVYFLTY